MGGVVGHKISDLGEVNWRTRRLHEGKNTTHTLPPRQPPLTHRQVTDMEQITMYQLEDRSPTRREITDTETDHQQGDRSTRRQITDTETDHQHGDRSPTGRQITNRETDQHGDRSPTRRQITDTERSPTRRQITNTETDH